MKCPYTRGFECPNVDTSDMTKTKSCNSCDHNNVGDMIRVWVEHKGMFDMDTPLVTLLTFYNKVLLSPCK